MKTCLLFILWANWNSLATLKRRLGTSICFVFFFNLFCVGELAFVTAVILPSHCVAIDTTLHHLSVPEVVTVVTCAATLHLCTPVVSLLTTLTRRGACCGSVERAQLFSGRLAVSTDLVGDISPELWRRRRPASEYQMGAHCAGRSGERAPPVARVAPVSSSDRRRRLSSVTRGWPFGESDRNGVFSAAFCRPEM